MIDKLPDSAADLVKHVAPVLVGTAVSMFFMRVAWPRRILQGFVGVPFSIYMAPFVDRVLSSMMLPHGFDISSSEAGVVTAVFGMTLVAYIYEVIQQLQIGPILREFISSRLGVKGDKKDVNQSD